MATISNRWSTLASDPLRGFKFYAKFTDASGDQGAFSTKIKTPTTLAAPNGGVSTGFFGGFTQIGGLQVQVQDIPYREGGFNVTAHHMPGLVTFPPVVFQRGVLYGNDQSMTWLRGLIAVADGGGLNGNSTGQAGNFRVNVEIFAADHPNTSDTLVPRIGWKLHNAWLTSLNYTDLNAVANEVMFETMTLVHEGMEVFYTKADEKDALSGNTGSGGAPGAAAAQ